MLNLEFELIAILILAAVIGILMGRFLCKSGESEEREKKKKIIHAFKTSENELDLSRESIKKQLLKLKEQEDKIATQEQEISNSKTKVHSSDTQRVKLLDELKILEKYKSRFESLDSEFKLQNKILDGLKEEKIANQKEIADFKIMINRLNKEKESMFFKETEQENSLRKTHEKYQTKLEVKELTYEKLEEDSIGKYREMVQVKDEAYDELKRALDSVENEYEEFKINYTLDSDRLDTLELDHQKIYHTLETVVQERDDLVARLRAISSVVGAVGIDGSSGDKNQQLLENR